MDQETNTLSYPPQDPGDQYPTDDTEAALLPDNQSFQGTPKGPRAKAADMNPQSPAAPAEHAAEKIPGGTVLAHAIHKDAAGFPSIGDLIEGTAIAKTAHTIFVDLGAIGTGIIFGREFRFAKEFIKHLNVGDGIKAKVVELDNEDGYIELSLQEAGREMLWERLRAQMENGEVVTPIIQSANRGGLVADIEGIQAFLPVSQLSSEHYPRIEGGDKEKIFHELQKFVGKPMAVQILDIDPSTDKLILSERLKEDMAVREKLKHFHIGDVVSGAVSGVVDFGAFVKFGEDRDLEGLAHISELDWQLVEDPRALLHVGQEVKAKIIGIEGDKISLSVKALQKDPWLGVAETHKRGDVIEGTVTRLNPFGAFVKIAPGVQGLVHIAEFRNAEHMREALTQGETYRFRIASLEAHEHRLSLKPVRPEHETEGQTAAAAPGEEPAASASAADASPETPAIEKTVAAPEEIQTPVQEPTAPAFPEIPEIKETAAATEEAGDPDGEPDAANQSAENSQNQEAV